MKKAKKKKIDIFNYGMACMILFFISFVFKRTGLLDIIGNDTSIQIGELHLTFKFKILLYLVLYVLTLFLHEAIHAITGKLVVPNAKFKIVFKLNDVCTRRVGGDPTRIQAQILSIMPFVVLSIVFFVIGYAIKDKNDIMMYFVLFNTPASVLDVEWFLYLFCYPKGMYESEIYRVEFERNSLYRKFWGKWNDFFCD